MPKSLKLIVVGLFILAMGSTAMAGRYSDAFPQYLADHSQDAKVTAIITMADQVNLRTLQDGLYAQHADRRAWHEAVVRALQEKATISQADIMSELSQMVATGEVEKYHGLWIGNIIIVTATPATFDRLVSRNDVLMISPNYDIESIKPVEMHNDLPVIAGHEIGADRLNVPQCWAMGITGEGRLVSHLDTGVDGHHPALTERWRGTADSRYTDHPEWAWFDPETSTQYPFDSGQHGTHTMGTMCGRSTTTNDTVGMAIDAQWISAGVIDRGGIGQTVTDALLAFQWVADPDGDPSTVWDVPDACSNSWGVMTSHGYPPCDDTFWSVLDGCEAAGIVVVFAAGNEGPTPNSLRRPADRATTDLTSFSVGAVDGHNNSLPIADFSSRGPSNCTPDGNDTFKPEVVAPGVNVRSSIPGGSYDGSWSGTSMATPHIAGIVALMRQANPNLTSEQIRQILLDTATDLGTAGEDNTYGMGIANAFAAVNVALSLLNGWGTLGGVVTDQASGNPIAGARLSVIGRPWTAATRGNGQFFFTIPADTAWTIKVEYPPTHLPIFDTVTVVENDTIFQNYALEGKVTVTLKASFANPVDASYRSFYIKGSWDSDGFYDAGWTAPAIEVKDDGVAPDLVANDGIFTGAVMLARDMVHTYSWAIYSENYGGEAARLQSGANFQIHSLTPPTVTTLAVNPSGSDNNWDIAAFCSSPAIFLDLVRGVNNRPTKWGAAESLTVGVTYSFRFRVMHSTVASYGVGGIGGANITYTPTASGNYDIIFDDRDDSYLIQLVGTDGPPTYVGATSGLDGHIPVSWLPPGTVASQEMAYDDGTLANAWYYYDFTALMANMFTPTGTTVIDSVMIHVLTDGDQYWPWPDGTHDPIGISIFLDDGSGTPQTDPVWTTEATGEPGAWISVDVPDIEVPSGSFWVAMNNLAGGGDEGLGLDASTDYPANKWQYYQGVWSTQDLYSGDQMIRAKVFGNAGSRWLSYDSKPAFDLKSSVPHATNSSNATGTGHANSSPSLASKTVYHPKLIPSNDPVPFDNEVLEGYNLYRGTASGPYNGGAPNRVNGSTIITATNYDDWGGAVGPIVNGQLYYYQASAVYNIGGGRHVEVGPSNEVTATAVNHPPQAPFNLVGTVNVRTINVHWSFANADSDFAHFNVYKRLMPGGTTTLVGSPTDSSFSFNIPDGEDGIYKVTVTAVDDGSPALESDPSHEVYLAIGHLPPSALAAISGHEFAVPLRWLLPGSWRSVASSKVNHTSSAPRALDMTLKGQVGPVNPPVIQNQGGPDEFGYSWIDSDEPGGPSYDWRDISGNGTLVPMSDDSNAGPFDIGFDVNFYGNTFNQFYICSNGWVSFTSTNSDFYNYQLPDPTAPENMLAPFWDDLNATLGGQVYYYSDGSELVISYVGIMHYISGGPYTFEVVIRQSGTVYYEYQSMGTPVDQCTVGLQNGDGTIGMSMVYNASYLHDEMAIRIGTGPEGVSPVHFKLYRATSPNVPIDQAHLRNGSIAGDQTSYTDIGGMINGQNYYYKLTAVWTDSVESPATNEAMGTPANHPPLAPFNLVGSVNDRIITARWSFHDSLGDWAHFNVYKRLMPGGTTTFVGSTADSVLLFGIPNGEDGVYKITVTAVDNGTPPLESDPSTEVYLTIGHLPPSALTAISGEEFAVPLRWMLPGSWRTTAISRVNHTPDPPMPSDVNRKNQVEPINPPVIQNQGGPDEFGYSWIDSDEPGGPTYSWRDITGNGTAVPLTDDSNAGPFDVGFDFSYYGNTFNQFYICSNGFVSFTSTSTSLGNVLLPDPTAPLNLLAPFWDDLNPSAGGQVYYYSDGSELVIAFVDVPHYSSGGPYTFEVVIRQSGTMFYEYQTANNLINSCTVGLQNGDGTIGMTMAYNANYLHDEMAIRIGTGPEGIPPAHFKLYRATAPNVPIDQAHLRNGSIAGDQTSFTDIGGLVNGQTYYYKLTAVWPDSIESPATNEAAGTPANHPPLAPYGLHGTVSDRNVTLYWSFNNAMGDLAHYNIYKKIVPGGTYALAGTSADTTEVITIPAGQDGVYAFAITAVDNGTPALESPYSNAPFFPVGNLPAINLTAITDQDGYVPLHWSVPGIRPTTTITYDDGALANAWYYYDFTAIMANMFTATSPIEIDTLWVHVLTEGDPYWPWPDGTADPVGISVYDDDGSGQPGDQIFYEEVTGEIGEWIMVPIDGGLTANGPNFWVGMQNLTGGGDEGLGLDASTDYPANKWQYYSSVWSVQDLYSGDQMIRATIVDNGRTVTLSESAPTLEKARQAATAGNSDAASPSIVASSGLKMPTVNSLSGGGGEYPRPLDTQDPVGYNIYRATAPNVPRDVTHRIRGYANQIGTSYNDSAVVNGTTYYYVVTAVYNNGGNFEEAPPTNEVSATPRMGARMVLNPLSYNVSCQTGHSVTANLNISNPGGMDLNYSIFASSSRLASQHSRRNGTTDALHGRVHEQLDKNNLPQEPTNPPVLTGRGGPDDFGYQWIDSDEPGGPTYEWIDITGIGEQIPMTGDDQNLGPYDIGFDFPFYGNMFSSFYICSNGWMSFSSTNVDYFNLSLPNTSAPLDLIAPFWDDMNPTLGGEYWFYSDGTQCVISFIDVAHYISGGPYTYQVVLSPNGAVTVNYNSMIDPLDQATIGIQNSDGTIGLQVAYNQSYVHDEMTVKFNTGWLSVLPTGGTVAPGANTNAIVTFDASSLEVGVYTGSLIVTGTDVNHQVGTVTIPATFHVDPVGVEDNSNNLPKEFALAQNYPNPFNPTTEIRFALPTKSHVTLDVYNVLGQKVKTLVNDNMDAGYKSVTWNGTDQTGSTISSGTYFYILKTGDKTFTKKMTMLK
jgi:hypothetical protein